MHRSAGTSAYVPDREFDDGNLKRFMARLRSGEFTRLVEESKLPVNLR